MDRAQQSGYLTGGADSGDDRLVAAGSALIPSSSVSRPHTAWHVDRDRRSELLKSDGTCGHRPCTDVWAAVLFLAVMVYMAICSVRVHLKADLRTLAHGRDFKGQFCGLSASVKQSPFVFWPTDPTTFEINPSTPICVPKCFSDQDVANGVTVKIPLTNATDLTQSGPGGIVTFQYADSFVYPSKSFAGMFCFPNNVKLAATLAHRSGVSGFWMSLSRGAKTISESWLWLTIIAIAAVAAGLSYIVFLQFIGGPLIRLCLTLAPLLTILLGAFLIVAGFVGASDPLAARIDSLLSSTTSILGLGILTFGGLLLVCVFLIRESAQTALSILEAAIARCYRYLLAAWRSTRL